MEASFNDIQWANIGMNIDDLEKTLENPETVNVPLGKPVVKPIVKDSSLRKAVWVCLVIVTIGITIASFMVV